MVCREDLRERRGGGLKTVPSPDVMPMERDGPEALECMPLGKKPSGCTHWDTRASAGQGPQGNVRLSYISENQLIMRLLFTLAIALLHCMAFGQITLEHTYPNAGYWSSYSQLMMVDLEVSGMSYVQIDRATKEIKLYHLDHTLFKTVSYSAAPQPPYPYMIYIMYISEHLFDQDEGLEYMYVDPLFQGDYLTQVYNEDGSLLLDEPGAYPMVLSTSPTQQLPIYNTDEGTKLILSHRDSTARVYSLGGTLSVGLSTAANGQLQEFTNTAKLFPNPTSSLIHFTLASALQQEAELTISDNAGRVVKTVSIARGTSQVAQDVSDLPDGLYLYRLMNNGTRLTSGTFVRTQ